MDGLERMIEYEFHDKNLLKMAMSHTSYVNEQKNGSLSNERLEFLGDSILGMVTAHYLFTKYPNMPEGNMTKRRAELVCEQSLAEVGIKLHLGEYLLLGKGEEMSGGRTRVSIIADAVESLIAAIYMDGSRLRAKQFVYDHILSKDNGSEEIGVKDYKTVLQELVQKKKGSKIEYCMLRESGPDHDKSFEAAVLVNDVKVGEGVGKSKKVAEQQAAKAALESLKDKKGY